MRVHRRAAVLRWPRMAGLECPPLAIARPSGILAAFGSGVAARVIVASRTERIGSLSTVRGRGDMPMTLREAAADLRTADRAGSLVHHGVRFAGRDIDLTRAEHEGRRFAS